MIQVCSRCGTRWNVRDRRRESCPRCHGALLAPSTEAPAPVWSAPGHDHRVVSRPAAQRPAQRLPPGYRWIAVRPGSPPLRRRRRRPLGPTPRYSYIPRWGLVDPGVSAADVTEAKPAAGPSPWAVRAALITTVTVLGAAALLHVLRYALLIVNRSTLLHPLIAGSVTWLGVVASVGAFLAVIGCAVVLARWLIARRAAAFAHHGRADPRSVWALRAGSLIPFVNLLWAPVFVIELAAVEDRLSGPRRPILLWWVLWVASTAVSVFATATSFTETAQGIADNTVSFIFAYFLAAVTVAAVARVVLAFDRKPVERPAHRWLIVPADSAEGSDSAREPESARESAETVESERQDPAA
ncbi:MAG: DUF4328 domain-containing protein [Mycobacteriaceae bacterium]|nr:DUF4328 domain-containing protein [Mycobacteriaceae bacterium]